MRAPVAQVRPGDALARAAELMRVFGVREVPVVEDGVLVGIVACSDLQPYTGYLELTPVRIAMTWSPRTVGPDDSLDSVAQALAASGFNALPVVAGGALAGMINRQDLLRALSRSANGDC
jgi:CBS domain-containing protein